MRVAIIGNSGSGKSTLADELARRCGLAVLDLDTVAWEPDRIAVARDAAAACADVRAFCDARRDWVVEGCYASLVAESLAFGPTLVFLDPGVEACLAHCRQRPWEPHKYESRQAQDANLEMLVEWISQYEQREDTFSRRAHLALYESFGGKKTILTRNTSTLVSTP